MVARSLARRQYFSRSVACKTIDNAMTFSSNQRLCKNEFFNGFITSDVMGEIAHVSMLGVTPCMANEIPRDLIPLMFDRNGPFGKDGWDLLSAIDSSNTAVDAFEKAPPGTKTVDRLLLVTDDKTTYLLLHASACIVEWYAKEIGGPSPFYHLTDDPAVDPHYVIAFGQ